MVIIDYYNGLDIKDKKTFRDKVLELTGMSYSTFYTKISGKQDFSAAEIYMITSLIPFDNGNKN